MTTPDVLDGAEIEKIVAGLTKAQVRAILTGRSSGPGCWPMRHALARKGLAKAMPFRLSDVGQQVRAHLARTRRVVDARSHGGEG